MLDDLGIIALENARTTVKQRQTFRATNKAENVAPLTFEFDPDGQYAVFAATLRNRRAPRKEPGKTEEESLPSHPKEETKFDLNDLPEVDGSARTPSRKTRFLVRDGDEDTAVLPTPLERWDGDGEDSHATNVEYQQTVLDAIIADKDSEFNETDRKIISMYISLTASEFIYVLELQKAYDEARCYFSQWVISKEIKELVNSARLTAQNEARRFTENKLLGIYRQMAGQSYLLLTSRQYKT